MHGRRTRFSKTCEKVIVCRGGWGILFNKIGARKEKGYIRMHCFIEVSGFVECVEKI